jgi:hypothetical protein
MTRAIWARLRPHLLHWHMIPCVAMMGGHNHDAGKD